VAYRIDSNMATTSRGIRVRDVDRIRCQNSVKLVSVTQAASRSETTIQHTIPCGRPNPYQSRIQFRSWILSKLNRGNTYVLRQRDQRGIVNASSSIRRVTPAIADDGSVFYRLNATG
jgi:phage portal protein BeeE